MPPKCPQSITKHGLSSFFLCEVFMSQRRSEYKYLDGTCGGRTFCLTSTDTFGSRQAAQTNTRICYIILSELTDRVQQKEPLICISNRQTVISFKSKWARFLSGWKAQSQLIPRTQMGCVSLQVPLGWQVLRALPLRANEWLQENSTISVSAPGTHS